MYGMAAVYKDSGSAFSAVLCVGHHYEHDLALALFDLPFILGGAKGGVSGSLDFVNLVFYRYTFGSALNGKSEIGFGASICVVMFAVMLIITTIQNKVLKKFEYDN